MREIVGVGVGRGAVTGPVVRAHPVAHVPADLPVPDDLSAAAARVEAAFAEVAATLQARADAATGALSAVLGATASMAGDRTMCQQVVARVQERTAPSVAVHQVVGQFVEMFRAAGGYMAERATDLLSVRDRVVALLEGLPEPGVPALEGPAVVVAEDLSPADTAVLDLSKVLAIVIEKGGPTSHTAIIAGQLGLPCIVRATGAHALVDGEEIAVDAARGVVTIAPDSAVRAAVDARRTALASLAESTADGATSDGHGIQLLANIGTAQDAERLVGSSVQGVGLFRTEVLFLDASTAPSEDEQSAVYARALRALGDRKVVIRTLDAGADKPLAFVTQPGEENPALGVRGYRLVRTAPQLLQTQLASIARAAADTGGDPWVMAPMITTADEARDFAVLARGAGISRVGVMIEVPAVALRAHDVLAEVDFVSIGTNDLAQYTMATDRLRGELLDLLDMWQPAVLDLVATVARAGVQAGKPVGVCGESAADPVMALVLAGLGITSLSMAPAAIPSVRFALGTHSLATCRAVADAARTARSAADAYGAALSLVEPAVREVLALA